MVGTYPVVRMRNRPAAHRSWCDRAAVERKWTPGHYQVVSKDRDHVSSEFGDYVDDYGNVVRSNIDVRKDRRPPGTHFDGARMPYCMHFNGGYAMHEGYVPPYAASHGCIRLPKGMAQPFFENAPEGTPVIVRE